MPWCPKCKAEYRPEVGVCPDCDEQLCEQPRVPPKPTAPLRPPSGIVSVLAAIVVSIPAFLVSGFLVAPLLDRLSVRWLTITSVEEQIIYGWILAAALAGFLTGALLNGLVRPIHVHAAGTVVGLWFVAWMVFPMSAFGWNLPSLREFLTDILGPVLVLPQLVAAVTSARGIAFARGSRLKNLAWMVGFLAVLTGAMLAMRPLFNLTSR